MVNNLLPGRILALATSAIALVACSSDNPAAPIPAGPKGIVVMDGFIQPGLNMLADTGTAITRLNFGPPSEFDAGVFTLERDTVLAVSSRLAGDFLYVADIRAGTVRRVQLPVGSNASRARLSEGGSGSARVMVALPDSQLVAVLTVPASGSVSIERIAGAGQCPVDALRFDGAVWVIDANSDCRTDYTSLGPTRLIRIPDGGGARDTVTLALLRGSGISADLRNGILTIVNAGDADFSSFPYLLRSASTIAQVDLRSKEVLRQSVLLGNSYGATLRRGLDNHLYVSLYEDLATFTGRVMQFREDLGPAGTSPASPLGVRLLFDQFNEEISCGAATADAQGRLHCISLGLGSATTLHVFDLTGHEIRNVAAGQGGVDLAIRP